MHQSESNPERKKKTKIKQRKTTSVKNYCGMFQSSLYLCEFRELPSFSVPKFKVQVMCLIFLEIKMMVFTT